MKRKDALWIMQMCRDRDARSEAEREAFDTAIDALKSESIFTADRPRGEWINTAPSGRSDNIICDQCGYNSIAKYVYCPNCGSDNRERSEGE